MTTHIYNVCKNKGNDRIWLERSRLTDNGFNRGMRFAKSISRGVLVLDFTATENAQHTIAGTTTRPIIDLCGKWVSTFFGGYTQYTASFDTTRQRITIRHA